MSDNLRLNDFPILSKLNLLDSTPMHTQDQNDYDRRTTLGDIKDYVTEDNAAAISALDGSKIDLVSPSEDDKIPLLTAAGALTNSNVEIKTTMSAQDDHVPTGKAVSDYLNLFAAPLTVPGASVPDEIIVANAFAQSSGSGKQLVATVNDSPDEVPTSKAIYDAYVRANFSVAVNSIGLIGVDGQRVDSGKRIQETMTDTADYLPTSAAIKTYGDANWAGGGGPSVDTAPTNSAVNAISSQWAYGMDGQRSGWRYEYNSTGLSSKSSPGNNTWYNLGGSIGSFGGSGQVWDISYTCSAYCTGTGLDQMTIDLSTSSAASGSWGNIYWNSWNMIGGGFTGYFVTAQKKLRITMTGAVTLYLNVKCLGTTRTNLYIRGDLGKTQIIAQRIR